MDETIGLRESLPVDADAQLAQGDIVVGLRDDTADGFVVVTADCDLVHAKFGGRLTALPFISLAEYVRDHWMKRNLLVDRDQVASRICEEMARLLAKSEEDLPEPSPERLLSWPLTTSPTIISATLCLTLAEVAELDRLTDLLRRIDLALPGELPEQWRVWSESAVSAGMSSLERASDSHRKRLSKELPRNLPGDVMYLDNPLRGSTSGYVALARFPATIAPDDIACKPADEAYGDPAYRRVGRLAAPYRYRLTQLFAEIYSAIGLSADYEDARSRRFTELAEALHEQRYG